jgi:hypothetical protein
MSDLRPNDQGRGQLRESEGRYFYDLFNVFGFIASVRINERQRHVTGPHGPFRWSRDMQENPPELKLRVSAEVLASHAELMQSIPSDTALMGKVQRHLGRRLTAADVACLRQWRRHVVDDFFVVGHVKEGAVLVQLYRDDSGGDNLFVVKGLADPLGLITDELGRRCSALGWALPMCHAALVPSPTGTGITYLGVMTLACTDEWQRMPPQRKDAMFQRAKGAYARAKAAGTVHFTLDSDALTKSPPLSRGDTGMGPMERAAMSVAASDPRSTAVDILFSSWVPTALGSKDPNFKALVEDAVFTRPYTREGFKHLVVVQEIYSDDAATCPMCYGHGWGTSLPPGAEPSSDRRLLGSVEGARPFRECCKPKCVACGAACMRALTAAGNARVCFLCFLCIALTHRVHDHRVIVCSVLFGSQQQPQQ